MTKLALAVSVSAAAAAVLAIAECVARFDRAARDDKPASQSPWYGVDHL